MVSQFTIRFHIAAHFAAFYTFRLGAAFHTISILAAFSYIFNIAALFGCVLYPPLTIANQAETTRGRIVFVFRVLFFRNAMKS